MIKVLILGCRKFAVKAFFVPLHGSRDLNLVDFYDFSKVLGSLGRVYLICGRFWDDSLIG